jgi:hypothetical protein
MNKKWYTLSMTNTIVVEHLASLDWIWNAVV